MKAAAHFIRNSLWCRYFCRFGDWLGGYVHAAKGADISPAAETPQDGGLSADVRALLAPLAAKRVEGTFEERRSVPGFPKPMLSRGHFTLEGESLVWQTQTPFASLMKVTPEGVFLEAAGEKQALTAAEISCRRPNLHAADERDGRPIRCTPTFLRSAPLSQKVEFTFQPIPNHPNSPRWSSTSKPKRAAIWKNSP